MNDAVYLLIVYHYLTCIDDLFVFTPSNRWPSCLAGEIFSTIPVCLFRFCLACVFGMLLIVMMWRQWRRLVEFNLLVAFFLNFLVFFWRRLWKLLPLVHPHAHRSSESIVVVIVHKILPLLARGRRRRSGAKRRSRWRGPRCAAYRCCGRCNNVRWCHTPTANDVVDTCVATTRAFSSCVHGLLQ